MQKLDIVILAAGNGTRMKSTTTPKVLHKISGLEILFFVIMQSIKLNHENIYIVVSKDLKIKLESNNNFIREYKEKVQLVIQEEQLGTAHALQCVVNKHEVKNDILVLLGDTPLITNNSLKKVINNNSSILGFMPKSNEHEYGRLKTDNNLVTDIIEFKDQKESDKQYKICNSGVIFLKFNCWKQLLFRIDNNNNSKEYYITDIVKIAQNTNNIIEYITVDEQEVMGINNKVQLSQANKIMQNRIKKKLMLDGVEFLDPDQVYICYNSIIEAGTIIHPFVSIGNNVTIESNVEIKSFTSIEESYIKANAIIGPHARIRPNTVIGNNVKVGNFVEIKKSQIDNDTKINHLSYIGDSIIGKNVNVGAGTVICNYNGFKKFQSFIDNDVFIGSNTTIISPVTINKASIIAAGSVITNNIESNDLAISRVEQKNIKDKAKYIRSKNNIGENNE